MSYCQALLLPRGLVEPPPLQSLPSHHLLPPHQQKRALIQRCTPARGHVHTGCSEVYRTVHLVIQKHTIKYNYLWAQVQTAKPTVLFSMYISFYRSQTSCLIPKSTSYFLSTHLFRCTPRSVFVLLSLRPAQHSVPSLY